MLAKCSLSVMPVGWIDEHFIAKIVIMRFFILRLRLVLIEWFKRLFCLGVLIPHYKHYGNDATISKSKLPLNRNLIWFPIVADSGWKRFVGKSWKRMFKRDFSLAACEPGALELACVINAVQDIIVCGHSDCKVSSTLATFPAVLPFFQVDTGLSNQPIA